MGSFEPLNSQANSKMPACPPEIIKKFEEHGFEKDWVQGEYDLFMEKNPSGQIKKADALKRLEAAAKERFPNAVPENVAQALYPPFDPAAKGLAILFCARIEIRAQLFFSIVDESGDGKINKAEMKKFLQFVNETQGLGKNDKEVDAI